MRHAIRRVLDDVGERVDIAAKRLMAQMKGIAPGQLAQAFGQLICRRHPGVLEQDRDHGLAGTECEFKLKAHEILRVIEAAPAGRPGLIEPAQ